MTIDSVPPQIALLVPCYNAAAFLPRFREFISALKLEFTSVLLYDDGSTDDTVAVARSLDFNIIEGRTNRGVAFARNQLVRMASSEWIHFHDADDMISPDYVQRLAPLCTESADIVSCDADWIDEYDRRILIRWRYDPESLAKAPLKHLLSRAMGLNSSIIRRSAWESVGGCDERLKMWEDADVHIRLANAGFRFRHHSEVLTWSLRRPTSFSHDYRTSWSFRLTALERYASEHFESMAGEVLAEAVEAAATALAELGDAKGSKRAIKLCRQLGRNPPTSKHPLVRALKYVVPAYPLLALQARRRSLSR